MIISPIADPWNADLLGLSTDDYKTQKSANTLIAWMVWKEHNVFVLNATSSSISQVFGRVIGEARCWQEAGNCQLDRLFQPLFCTLFSYSTIDCILTEKQL